MAPRVSRDPPPGLSCLVSGSPAPLSGAKGPWDQGFRSDRVSHAARFKRTQPRRHTAVAVGSRLATLARKLGRAQPCRDAALRHNRVSPLGAERGQDQLGVPGRGDGGRGPRRRPGRPDIVLVVRSRHDPVPPPPGPTALGMALLLTGRRPAGPLARPQPRVGTEERVAERTTPAPRSSGHRCTSQMEGVTVPDAPGSRSGWMRGGQLDRT
jgi:hypothetical protein